MNDKKQSIIFGLHAIQALLNRHPQRVNKLLLLQGRDDQRMQQVVVSAQKSNIKIERVHKKDLDALCKEANHQGVVAMCRQAEHYNENDLADILQQTTKPPLLLILDGVQDPHNLGACLRSADAAGVDAVIAPKDRAVALNETVRKVASGAAEFVPFVQVTNLARTLKWLKDQQVWIYGAAGEAEKSIYQIDFTGPIAMVMGAEGKGLRRLTRENCDELMKIPMWGSVASLNVSVATGVCLFEACRQRCLK